MAKARKYTDDKLKEICKENNFNFIGTTTNGKTRFIEVECKNGHMINVTLQSFIDNRSCKKCNGINKYSIEEAKNNFASKGFTLLEDKYINAHTKMKVICSNGHEIELTWNAFQQGNRCRICSSIALSEKQRTPYAEVLKVFESRNCILLTKEYVNFKSKLEYICPNFPNEIQTTTFASFRKGHCCRSCQKLKLRNDRKFQFEDVILEFKENNLELISSAEDYNNCFDKLQYKCLKHSYLGIQETVFANLKHCKISICPECYKEMTQGENHPSWKGGLTELKDYLRGKITEWKKESIKKSNFKCVISGEKFTDIHHLYGFNLILEETLNILKAKRLQNIAEYTEEELSTITQTFLRIHDSYPLGVCLSEHIHKLFHNHYGYGNNTPKQFEEFTNRYKKGEFNK